MVIIFTIESNSSSMSATSAIRAAEQKFTTPSVGSKCREVALEEIDENPEALKVYAQTQTQKDKAFLVTCAPFRVNPPEDAPDIGLRDGGFSVIVSSTGKISNPIYGIF